MTSPTTDRRYGLVGNQAIKAPVTARAASNITQSGQQTIDGVAVLAVNANGVPDRVLCTGMTDQTKNGIWDVSSSAWTRSLDADGSFDLQTGTTVLVNSGTLYSGGFLRLTTPGPITIGTSNLIWSVVAGSGSLGSGTVTNVSITPGNGFSGSVSNPTTTPALSLSTTVTGMVKGNGTAISAAAAAVDFVAPSAYASANGLTINTAKVVGRATAGNGPAEELSTTGTGNVVLSASPVLTGSVSTQALSVDGNINLNGTGRRIIGLFGGSPTSNRAALQTSIAGDLTSVSAAPNGAGDTAIFACHSDSTMVNSSICNFGVGVSLGYAFLQSSAIGTGTVLPLQMLISGVAALTIGTDRSVKAAVSLGYSAGSGGTVGQLTSKATGVTINKICGQVTTFNDALGANTNVSFVVTNSTVVATDTIIANLQSGGTANAYGVWIQAVGASSFTVTLHNFTAGPLSEALVINFSVIKSVNA